MTVVDPQEDVYHLEVWRASVMASWKPFIILGKYVDSTTTRMSLRTLSPRCHRLVTTWDEKAVLSL
jgi:hypothetical protein